MLTPGLSPKAYQVFVEEVAKHLEHAKTTIIENSALSPEDLRRACAGFHTIRGSAGFFGLSDVATTAERLESLLLDEETINFDKLGTVKQLLLQFEKLVDNLEPPAE